MEGLWVVGPDRQVSKSSSLITALSHDEKSQPYLRSHTSGLALVAVRRQGWIRMLVDCQEVHESCTEEEDLRVSSAAGFLDPRNGQKLLV